MNDLARGLWERANKALLVARSLLSLDPDAAASRAYYCALYAVSAHFALKGETFKKHSAVEIAVHRDLVKTGVWSRELGAKYSMLAELRGTGDYGTLDHVSDDEARRAVEAAADIVRAVSQANPQTLTGSDDRPSQ
jgi:uncharacterized protein (UPF0332 family)